MSIRDQILTAAQEETDGFTHEIIAIPEWGGVKVMVRELSVGDKRLFYARGRKLEEIAGGKWTVLPNDDPLSDLYLVFLCTWEEDGSARTFQESDIAQLAAAGEKTDAAVRRLADKARELSHLDEEPIEGAVTDEATAVGKDSETPTDEQSSNSPTS